MSIYNQPFDPSKLKNRQEVAKMRGNHVFLLSPDIAKKWLESFNSSNRPLSESTAREYARRMTLGEWVLNGETIKFSNTGEMIDGQHRCRAVVIYGDCIQVELRFGLDAKVFDTLDEGKKRTGRDILAIDGVPNYSIVAAATSLILIHERGVKGMESKASNINNRPSNKEVRQWYYEHPEISEMVLLSLKWYELSARLLSPSKFAAYYYLFSRKNMDMAESFLTKLAIGANLSASDPIFLLRLKLMQARFDRQRRLSPLVEKALIIKTWNYIRRGKTVKILKFDTINEPFPEIE